jgi:hypothetical protein
MWRRVRQDLPEIIGLIEAQGPSESRNLTCHYGRGAGKTSNLPSKGKSLRISGEISPIRETGSWQIWKAGENSSKRWPWASSPWLLPRSGRNPAREGSSAGCGLWAPNGRLPILSCSASITMIGTRPAMMRWGRRLPCWAGKSARTSRSATDGGCIMAKRCRDFRAIPTGASRP